MQKKEAAGSRKIIRRCKIPEERKDMGKKNRLKMVLLVFLVCSVVEYVEFLFIRTDQTILADNIITKLFCVLAVICMMRVCGYRFSDIGFRAKKIIRYIGYGLGLGILTFSISYLVEYLLLAGQGKSPRFSLYITNFGLSGATAEVSLSGLAVVICILVNILNVFAEEGLFRGFILKAVSEQYGFRTGNFVQAALFGIWHIVMCALAVYDGQMSMIQAVVFGIGYVVLAGILGIEWGTCVGMTGVLWVGLSEHYFNNFIGNILHVVSKDGTDEFQIVRIILSNVLSLCIVLLINKRKKGEKKHGGRKDFTGGR